MRIIINQIHAHSLITFINHQHILTSHASFYHHTHQYLIWFIAIRLSHYFQLLIKCSPGKWLVSFICCTYSPMLHRIASMIGNRLVQLDLPVTIVNFVCDWLQITRSLIMLQQFAITQLLWRVMTVQVRMVTRLRSMYRHIAMTQLTFQSMRTLTMCTLASKHRMVHRRLWHCSVRQVLYTNSLRLRYHSQASKCRHAKW